MTTLRKGSAKRTCNVTKGIYTRRCEKGIKEKKITVIVRLLWSLRGRVIGRKLRELSNNLLIPQ